jgi:tetratricopeptide (TPR) repeat protein
MNRVETPSTFNVQRSTSNVSIFLGLLAALLISFAARAAAPETAFDAANKLYEQGKHAEAAARFEALLKDAPTTVVHFNLGNAWFKAGQTGRAVAAWRQAERLAPRDPSVRFNLQFARKRVLGNEAPADPLWQRFLRALTLNEWTILATVVLWIWFLLLALREFKPELRRVLGGYTAVAGLGFLLLGGCLAAAAVQQFTARPAVVIVPQAIARTGPLDEAKPVKELHLRDGAEVTVLDQKEVTVADKKQLWLQIRDLAGRTGWLKSDQVLRLFP